MAQPLLPTSLISGYLHAEPIAMAMLEHAPNPAHRAHLEEASRVLALPVEASRLHWHPFGVYAIPLPQRSVDRQAWSRRLHLWHPDAEPVGPASPYGVHTHTGRAQSHVLAGHLRHHLYQFAADPDGAWQRAALGDPQGRAALRTHVQGTTSAGTTHRFPAHQPHGVGKGPGFAVSLFEQADEGPADQPFTTWQRTDVPAQPPQLTAPVPIPQVLRQARRVVDEALYAVRV